jgi:hypothetical protein
MFPGARRSQHQRCDLVLTGDRLAEASDGGRRVLAQQVEPDAVEADDQRVA